MTSLFFWDKLKKKNLALPAFYKSLIFITGGDILIPSCLLIIAPQGPSVPVPPHAPGNVTVTRSVGAHLSPDILSLQPQQVGTLVSRPERHLQLHFKRLDPPLFSLALLSIS